MEPVKYESRLMAHNCEPLTAWGEITHDTYVKLVGNNSVGPDCFMEYRTLYTHAQPQGVQANAYQEYSKWISSDSDPSADCDSTEDYWVAGFNAGLAAREGK